MTTRSRAVVLALAAVAVLGGLFVLVRQSRGPALPAPGSDTYEQMTRAFYWGLSALEVGLLDDARQQFTKATTIVPEEPAAWADLGLAQLRLGELDAAVAPIERALALAPGNSDLVLLAARMDEARGRLDEAVMRLRQAVRINPESLRARFALADELQRLNAPESDTEALDLLDGIIARAPANLAALVERARIAARRSDDRRLKSSRDALVPLSTTWPAQAAAQLTALEAAIDGGRFDDAARATTFLRNVLAPVPAFSESLAAVRTPVELIAEPFDRFLALTPPTPQPSPADTSIAFEAEPATEVPAAPPASMLVLFQTIEASPVLHAGSGSSIASLDWNHDFRTDVVEGGPSGVRLLLQDDKGGFADATASASAGARISEDVVGVWGADIEMDGDIDIVVAPRDGVPFVLRNRGDGTWQRVQPFMGITGARDFAWADMDQDADPDAVFLDALGVVRVFTNRQAGEFARAADADGLAGVTAVTVADIDADGTNDLVALDAGGAVRQISWDGTGWKVAALASDAPPGSERVLVSDLDNNGALDLIAAGGGRSQLWLAGAEHAFTRVQTAPEGEVFAAADRNGDGRVDLAAVSSGRPVWLMGRGGTAGYHWKVIRPRGQASAGDQRINSFGVGGQVSVRAGLLVQTQVLSGTPVHFGLGTHNGIDVARIVWPNGNAQAEFGTGVDDVIVAEQRLKGSCPWVFAWDGSKMGFVTDFLWRSPLGLRINARDTAGVSQTEDWVRIAGEQLRPRDGAYDVRITAELWETHFFDHVSLLVVDHPADTEMFVDERFLPSSPPALAPRALRMFDPVRDARDEQGHDVTDIVAARDGRYLATFPKGAYQGIAEEHFVEFSLPDRMPAARATLVANGWIYPTDSSINVAIGQGDRVRPSGLALEALDSRGRWMVVKADLGFPAGKNKTMLVDLDGVRGARRLRLRTNLEVYWDSLVLAEEVDVPLRTTRLAVTDAELRFRGYSETTSLRADAPETPTYERIASVSQRWRDLTGFHTRFGNVNALLAGVDDRYVIMNAGDEMRLRFAEQSAPESGWRRDFVLIGDGWEKDGDYNTGYSQTVLPLPSHDHPAYGDAGSTGALEDDPVYRRHSTDWEEYHTRFVTPRAFVRGLKQRPS